MHQKNFAWLIIILGIILLFPSLGKVPLWIYDEVRNAQCAREMYLRGDWIVPTFNGSLRTLKPPLHYFFMFGGFEIFGINEWGARFFSAICGLLTLLVTFLFIQHYSSIRHAFVTCLVLLASTHFLFEFRMSVPDPYLILLNTLGIFSTYAYFREIKLSWILIAGLSFGLSMLAKGPVGLVLPGAAIIAWIAWEKRWKQLFNWRLIPAAILMFAVAVPWYWAVHVQTNGEWTRGFFLEHNVGRFSEPMEGHGGIFLLVPLFILIGLLPASIFFGESLKNFKRRFTNPLMKLSLCVTAVFMIFYSISGTKLPNYPMPCYPFLAVLLGYIINKGLYDEKSMKMYPFLILLLVNVALPIGVYFGLKNEVNTVGLENYATALFILTFAAMLAVYFMMRKNFKRAMISTFAIYFVFHLLFFNWLYPTIYEQNPMSRTIDEVKTYDNVVAYQIFHPSYTFYLQDSVPVFDDLDKLEAHLDSSNSVVISRESFGEDLERIGLKLQASEHDIFESSTTVLYAK